MNPLINDVAHWQHLQPPLSPNHDEVLIYQQQLLGFQPVYLLGTTKELLPLCDVAVDLNPVVIDKPTLKCDWNDLAHIRAGAMVGDGVINLEGMSLVDKMLNCCDRLVCRVFLKKIPGMKYATHFPEYFPDATRIISTQKDVVIVVWDKRKQ